jgi:2-keto-4-pentenoate hydratase
MDQTAIEHAAAVLADANRHARRIDSLPDAAHPHSVAEAHAMQDALVAALNERVAGWKVSVGKDGEIMRGAILKSRLLQSPAELSAAQVPLRGIEAEIGFRFDRDMPPRDRVYERDEIAASVTALVGIEIVDSRFTSYRETPVLDRTADCMSNGAYIVGTARSDWRDFDLSLLKAILRVNGRPEIEKTASHPAGDPILPAIALVNVLRTGPGMTAGQIITTGTYTGLHFAQPGDHVVAEFEGFGRAELRLRA